MEPEGGLTDLLSFTLVSGYPAFLRVSLMMSWGWSCFSILVPLRLPETKIFALFHLCFA